MQEAPVEAKFSEMVLWRNRVSYWCWRVMSGRTIRANPGRLRDRWRSRVA